MILTDEELIKSYFNGDANAFALLLKKNLGAVFLFINRLCGDTKAAEDLTQETFIKVWKNLKKFDQNKKFKPWLFMIARNVSIDYLRKKKELVFSDLREINSEGEVKNFDPADSSISALEQLEHQALINKLEQGLRNLPADDRALLLLYYTEDITFREIGEMTKTPLDTIKSRYWRALAKLKKEMNKE